MSGIVIIGGGLGGGRAARTVRELGYEGDVTILAAEQHFPYERPPLSKEVLQGKHEPDSVYLKPDEWYADERIEVRPGANVTAIDTDAYEVTIDGTKQLAYDKLVIATGARSRVLPLEGGELEGVHTLRTVDESLALHAALSEGNRRLVVIGTGWIGMEVAASARALGNEVTVVGRGAIPLASALGDTLGAEFQRVHEAHGVQFLLNATVDRIEGSVGGSVEGVIANGETIPADIVVVGAGAIPNTELADAAGIAVDNGILADAGFQTSAPDVYAIGDVANVEHPIAGRRLRSEHWANALNQGKAVARALTGETVSYDEIPYFFTDQFELGMELSGYMHLMSDAKLVVRGDLEAHEYIGFWVREGKVIAGMNMNIWDVNEAVQALIRSDRVIDEAQLTDTNVSLADLAGA